MITRTIKTNHYTAHIITREEGTLTEKDITFDVAQRAEKNLDINAYAATLAENVLAVERVTLTGVTAETYAISYEDFMAHAVKVAKNTEN